MTEAYSSILFEQGEKKRQFFFRPKSSDENVINDIFVKRKYDMFGRSKRAAELLVHAQSKLRSTSSKPLIVDAGANIGASSIFLGATIPDTFVVAIEPDAGNYRLLKQNTEGLDIEPIHAAVSSVAGRMSVFDPGRGHWGYRTQPVKDDAPGSVVCITINDLYSRYRQTYFPFIAKIDIEGGEADLFATNTEWVERTPLLIVELHDWLLPQTANSRSFLRCVSQLNRDFVYIGEDVYSISNDLDGIGVDPHSS
jgi:FkbM family methyltransferase